MKKLQTSFTQPELLKWYTVDMSEKFIKTKVMPAAFGMSCATVSEIHRLFELRYISSS